MTVEIIPTGFGHIWRPEHFAVYRQGRLVAWIKRVRRGDWLLVLIRPLHGGGSRPLHRERYREVCRGRLVDLRRAVLTHYRRRSVS